jgi:hypothetical protein
MRETVTGMCWPACSKPAIRWKAPLIVVPGDQIHEGRFEQYSDLIQAHALGRDSYSKTMPVKQKLLNSTGEVLESICNMTF